MMKMEWVEFSWWNNSLKACENLMGGWGECLWGMRVRVKVHIAKLDDFVSRYEVLNASHSWTAAALLREQEISARDLSEVFRVVWGAEVRIQGCSERYSVAAAWECASTWTYTIMLLITAVLFRIQLLFLCSEGILWLLVDDEDENHHSIPSNTETFTLLSSAQLSN